MAFLPCPALPTRAPALDSHTQPAFTCPPQPTMIRAPPHRPLTAAPPTPATPATPPLPDLPPFIPASPEDTRRFPSDPKPRRRSKIAASRPAPSTVDGAARRDRTREFYFDDLADVRVASRSAVVPPRSAPPPLVGAVAPLPTTVRVPPPAASKKGDAKYARRSSNVAEDSIRSYLHEIGEVKLLDAESEVSLAREIARLLELERVSARLKELTGVEPAIPDWAAAAEMDIVAFRDTLRRGLRAKEHMVAANLRLVVSIAKKYLNRGLSFQDLIQEGSIGLIRGAEKFDGNKGFKFSTYATWWIRQAITRAIADHSRPIRLPVHVNDTIAAIKKTTKALHTELNRPPTESEVAERLQISVDKLRFLSRSSRSTISLETPIGRDGKDSNATLGSFIVWEGDTPEESTMKSLLREDLENVLNTLSPRERDVVRMRYGFDDGKMKTLEEIGCLFAVTRERIRQIEAKALRKLRHPNRNAVLREYVYEEQ